jgi:hypothetical protein
MLKDKIKYKDYYKLFVEKSNIYVGFSQNLHKEIKG